MQQRRIYTILRDFYYWVNIDHFWRNWALFLSLKQTTKLSLKKSVWDIQYFSFPIFEIRVFDNLWIANNIINNNNLPSVIWQRLISMALLKGQVVMLTYIPPNGHHRICSFRFFARWLWIGVTLQQQWFIDVLALKFKRVKLLNENMFNCILILQDIYIIFMLIIWNVKL